MRNTWRAHKREMDQATIDVLEAHRAGDHDAIDTALTRHRAVLDQVETFTARRQHRTLRMITAVIVMQVAMAGWGVLTHRPLNVAIAMIAIPALLFTRRSLRRA